MGATIHFLCRNYYARTALMSSRQIAHELRRNFNYLVDFQVRLFDPRINASELNNLIIRLDEDELRSGDANLIIYLRNRLGKYVEPSLELDEGFISSIPQSFIPKVKIISTEKLLLILRNKP